jgi:hypothetical protein
MIALPRHAGERRHPRLSLIAPVFVLAFSGNALAGQTLFYEKPVQLSGIISTEPFYGPPNWGEDPTTDAKETAIILNLDSPIDVVATVFTGSDLDSWQNERRVQLDYLDGSKNDSYLDPPVLLKLAGQHVTVSGTLYDRVRMFDRTDVVMDVRKIVSPAGLTK